MTRSLSKRVRVLAGVNAALLLALAAVALAPKATAQDGDINRAAGEYMLVGGEINSGNSNAVYVIDTANQEMVVLRWDAGRRNLEGIGFRSLNDDTALPSQR